MFDNVPILIFYDLQPPKTIILIVADTIAFITLAADPDQ